MSPTSGGQRSAKALRPAIPGAEPPGDRAVPMARITRRLAGAASKSVTSQINEWHTRRDLDNYFEDPQWRPAADGEEERTRPRRHAALVFLGSVALLVLGVTLIAAIMG